MDGIGFVTIFDSYDRVGGYVFFLFEKFGGPIFPCTWMMATQVKSGRVTVFPPEHGEMQAGMQFFAREFFYGGSIDTASIRQILDYVLYWAKEALFLRSDVRDAFHVHLDWQRQEFSTWSDEINLRRSCLNGTKVSKDLLCDKTIR